MKFGTGHKPDPASYVRPRFDLFAAVRGLSSTLPLFTTNAPAIAQAFPVANQKQTSRCTGFSTACAIAGRLAIAGTPLVFRPSPTRIYTNGRRIDDPFGPPLTDDGAQPNQVWRAASTFGVTSWDDVIDGPDVSPELLNADPGADDLLSSSAFLSVGEYALAAAGAARVQETLMALAAGRPVTVAICADADPIQFYAGDVLTSAMLGAAVDHYVCVVDYATTPSGLVLLVRNSWGTKADRWGVDAFSVSGLPDAWSAPGHFLVDESAIQTMTDLVVGDVSLREAA